MLKIHTYYIRASEKLMTMTKKAKCAFQINAHGFLFIVPTPYHLSHIPTYGECHQTIPELKEKEIKLDITPKYPEVVENVIETDKNSRVRHSEIRCKILIMAYTLLFVSCMLYQRDYL